MSSSTGPPAGVLPSTNTSPLAPTHDQVSCASQSVRLLTRLQVVVLYVVCRRLVNGRGIYRALQTVVYTVVIFGMWNIPGARTLINPLKLFTIGWHELCHIIAVGDRAALETMLIPHRPSSPAGP